MAEEEKNIAEVFRDFAISLNYILNRLQNSISELSKTIANIKPAIEKFQAFQLHDTRLSRLSVQVEPSFSDVNDVPKRALVDADRHVQADILTMPPVTVEVTEKGFADVNNVPTRALVDADRHVQADIVSMPPVTVEIAEKGFSNASDVPTRALVDADRHVQVDALTVANPSNLDVALSTRASETTLAAIKTQIDKLQFDAASNLKTVPQSIPNPPALDVNLSTRASEATLAGIKSQTDKLQFDAYNNLKTVPQSLPNPPNLDIALSTRASESTLLALKNALASVGVDKVRISVVDSLPAGTNKIGSVDAYKAGTWSVDNLLNPHPVDIARQGTIAHFNLTFTAAGSQTVYTPATGKKPQIIGFFMENAADVEAILRFATSGNVVAALPVKGVCAMNLIGVYPPTGAANETVEVYAAGATSVRGWICVVEAS